MNTSDMLLELESKTTKLTQANPRLHEASWFGVSVDEWVRKIVSLHFDPVMGSAYWLLKEKELGINARNDITCLEDLYILGPMEEEDLRRYPVEYFIPRCQLNDKKELILGETAGTTGLPKVTAYSKEEFYLTFVEWFRIVATNREFPVKVNWLWAGPGGPHIIGKAVGPVVNSMEGMDPFSLDMDPRWLKKLKPASIGYQRYISHIIEQALDIINRQHIEVLYTTPPLLFALANEMKAEQRMQIKGVHYGGVALDQEQLHRFKKELFPHAVHIAGYGNTLFGLCMEIEESMNGDLDYYPPGPRMIVQVVSTKDGIRPDKKRLKQTVGYLEKGQVVCHRLDSSFFIPNMFERDEAVRIAPSETVKTFGISLDGIRNPGLLKGLEANAKIGVY